MEAAGNGSGGGEAQLLISGVGGDQPLVMSAEDAAQFLAQAGLQLADVTDGSGQVIINSGDLESAGFTMSNSSIKVRHCLFTKLLAKNIKKIFILKWQLKIKKTNSFLTFCIINSIFKINENWSESLFKPWQA